MDETGAPPNPLAPDRLIETARRVLTDPKSFFAAMPRAGGYEDPGIFAVAMLVTSAVVTALLSLIGLVEGGFFASLFGIPIFGAIGIVIASAILLFASRALGGEASFESSFRIVGYASAVLPVYAAFSMVPYLPLVAIAYGIYMAIVAVIAVHRTPEDRTWMVFGGIGALLLAFLLVMTVATRGARTRLETFGEQMEKSAEDLERATDEWRREMERAAEKMKRDLDRAEEETDE